MDVPHPLKTLLQLQLASDSYAVLHLPHVLASLTSACFLPSPHTQKWTTRINSLLHSKDQGARWAGLCISYQTSLYSKSIMIECAQSWLGVALPTLSRDEPAPTLKAAMRLLNHIFSTATDVPEFQRQLVIPNVPKFSLVLIALADKHGDRDVKILSVALLAGLVPLYPTLHRAQHAALQTLTLKLLNGSTPRPTDTLILETASKLYSVIHFTGGKVGALNLWRKSLDETLAFSRTALLNLRSSFPSENRNYAPNQPGPSAEDPVIWIPLNIDRLRCGVIVICDLLRSTAHRPVHLPIGPLVRFAVELLSATTEKEVHGHVDATVRAMEVSAVPSIQKYGCQLLICLAKCARHHLTPNQTLLITYIVYHLEQPTTSSERLALLKAIQAVVTHCNPFHSSLLPSRLIKSILASLTIVLATQSEVYLTDKSAGSSGTSINKKGKKRARGYEGDEVFKTTREIVCPTVEDGEVLIAALDVTLLVLRNPHVTPSLHSIASRILLSMLLALPQMSPSLLSSDPTLHGRVFSKVHRICTELGTGTTSAMSKTLGLVIRASISNGSEHALTSDESTQRQFDILLHPRVPPIVRSLPHVESLSLFRAEEGFEEIDAREALGLSIVNQESLLPQSLDNISMAPTDPQPPVEQSSHVNSRVIAPATSLVQPHVPVSEPNQTKPTQLTPNLLFPPLLDPLPSASIAAATQNSQSLEATVSVHPASMIAPVDEEEEEDMPSIDMDSDSD